MNKINVAVVEDEEIIRESICDFLKQSELIEMIGAFSTSEDFMSSYDTLNVDVVLMDINLPEKNGIESVARLKPLKSVVQFLMCTSFDSPEKIYESLKVGATGYILKNSSPQKIIDAIIDIYNGGSPMSPQIARLVVGSFQEKNNNALLKSFTPREQEILHALSKGYQYKEIAERLFISVETVRTYLRKIYEKLQVHSKIEALNKVFPK